MSRTKPSEPDVDQVAAALRLSIGMLVRGLRQAPVEGELTMPETAALARLDRGGPSTVTELARAEQISSQSMGATLAGLERQGLLVRTPDPGDGRRSVIAVTDAGLEALRSRRSARTERLARALTDEFNHDEVAQLAAVAPLIERLAHSI